MITLLTEARVRVTTFAPHTTQSFQVLDVTLFGTFKRRAKNELPFEDMKASVKFIMNGCHDFKRTIMELNTWGAFQAHGFEFEFDRTSEPINFHSTRKSRRKAQAFESRGLLASSWISCIVNSTT
jgi:hypothetical protein